jgi:hypothetical protein
VSVDPYIVRTRLFLRLGIPARLTAVLHAWAIVEKREFCHDFMADLLCRQGTEKARRLAVARELDYLAAFLKTFPYRLGTVRRGGGKDHAITSYGPLSLNSAVSWIQDQIALDPDTSNPFVAADRYLDEAIARHIPKAQTKSENKKKKASPTREEEGIHRHTLGLTSVPSSFNSPECTFESALLMARAGFSVFPAWGVGDGVCFCWRGSECPNPGKHPCIRGWQQIATTYEPSLRRLWEKFPTANIGIATGKRLANGEFLTVIDCDHRSFGHGSLSHLERNELCALPLTREHSAGGGPHKYYSHPRGFRSAPSSIGKGIDVQSFGKFVIAPGSTHKSGRSYEVTLDAPIARLPEPWAIRLEAIGSKTLRLIPEGQRRTWLLKCAGAMVGARMDSNLVFEVLKDRRDRRCEKGSHSFSDDELRGMVAYCLRQERSGKVERAA